MNAPDESIILRHNLDPAAFMWLWAKYVVNPNLEKHCTACLKAVTVKPAIGPGAPYSRTFSKAFNPGMKDNPTLLMDEAPHNHFRAIYLCGVSAAGCSSKKNYPHNLHAAIVPARGASDVFEFENWKLQVDNGIFTRIPPEEELPRGCRQRQPEYERSHDK